MSHFSVLVIGPEPEKQLAPYHEFECTGTDDEFVKDIDITEEAREQFAKDETTYYQDSEGNLHLRFIDGKWDQKFWRNPTPEEAEGLKLKDRLDSYGKMNGIEWTATDWKDGEGYRAKFKFLPEGWKEVEAKTSLKESFAEFVEGYYGTNIVPFGQAPDLQDKHKYGYVLVDEAGDVIKVVDRTNPEKEWDWFQIGGRWNGFFKLKPTASGVLGRAGLQTMDRDYKPPALGRADVCRKGDIDIDGMRDESGETAAKQYDKYTALTAGCPTPLTWQQLQAKHTKDGEVDCKTARDEYHEQPVVKALNADSDREAIWWELDDFQCSREEYIEHARAKAIRTFAIVKDSLWYERGSMGWWGCVSDEKDENEWTKQFSDLVDSLPDDTLMSIADCHI
jgi:hypothetical protein